MKWMAYLTLIVMVLVLLAVEAKGDVSVRITFTGDVTLGSEEEFWQEEDSFIGYAGRNGYDYFLQNVRTLFEADDLTVVNLEGVLSDSAEDENTQKNYRFRGPVAFAQILSGSSVELANLANNHTLDYGERGYADTKATLDAVGVGHFGGRDAYIWEKNGVKIAFLGMSYTQESKAEKAWLAQEIARLKAEEGAAAVIFLYHGGQEYGKGRNKRQQEIARLAVDAGADLVVMHHPHVVQGMSVLDQRSVLYSLGNFCFGGNKRVRAIESLVAVVELWFSDEGVYAGQQVTLYPAHISGTQPRSNFQPTLVTGKEARGVMKLVQADTRFRLDAYDEELGFARQAYLPALAE